MPADALANLGASTSAGMVLTPEAKIFYPPTPHPPPPPQKK